MMIGLADTPAPPANLLSPQANAAALRASASQQTNSLSPADFAQYAQQLQPYCSAPNVIPDVQIACDAIAARLGASSGTAGCDPGINPDCGGGIGGFSASDRKTLLLVGAAAGLLLLAVVMK